MMIVVRVLPDVRWTQHQKSVKPQACAGNSGVGENGAMHVVVINDKQTDQDETPDDTAGQTNGQWKFHAGYSEQCSGNGDC